MGALNGSHDGTGASGEALCETLEAKARAWVRCIREVYCLLKPRNMGHVRTREHATFVSTAALARAQDGAFA